MAGQYQGLKLTSRGQKMIDGWPVRCCLGVALVAVGLALNPAAAETTLYKWVDEKGVTHYSEAPPPKKRSQALRIQTAPATTEGTGNSKPGQTLQEQETAFQERQKAREAGAAKSRETIQAAEKAASERNKKCANARARIERLQAERRSQLTWDRHRVFANEKADRAFDQRGIELNRLGKFVDENCPRE